MKLKLLLCTALLAGCTNSHEPPAPEAINESSAHDIVGIKLGADVQAIAECSKHREGEFNVYSIPYGPRPCTANSHLSLNAPNPPEADPSIKAGASEIEVQIAPPFGVKSQAKVSVVDGRVERVLISTAPVDAQRNVLDALTEKYGKPTSLRVRPMQNAFGAKLDSIEASWNLPLMDISFIGAVSLDEGVIVAAIPGRPSPSNPAKF